MWVAIGSQGRGCRDETIHINLLINYYHWCQEQPYHLLITYRQKVTHVHIQTTYTDEKYPDYLRESIGYKTHSQERDNTITTFLLWALSMIGTPIRSQMKFFSPTLCCIWQKWGTTSTILSQYQQVSMFFRILIRRLIRTQE